MQKASMFAIKHGYAIDFCENDALDRGKIVEITTGMPVVTRCRVFTTNNVFLEVVYIQPHKLMAILERKNDKNIL